MERVFTECAEVINSPWIEELRARNWLAGERHCPDFISPTARHIIMPFKENTFEAVAERYDVKTYEGIGPESALKDILAGPESEWQPT